MSTKLFVNLPVEDLQRSRVFFAALGFEVFGVVEGMASVIISQHTQVMLLTTPLFGGCASRPVAEADAATEVILVLGLADRLSVDRLVDTAMANGATRSGSSQDTDGRYQRGFFDLDGRHWEAVSVA